MDVAHAAPPAFFSYSREDSEFALRLVGDLKAAGAAVWLDQLDIQPGQRWDRAVEEALTRCVRMLVVLTPASINSTNVMDEVSFALEEGKTIIPIIHRDCVVPFRLRRLQHLDFRQDYSRALNELMRAMTNATQPAMAGPAMVTSPRVPSDVLSIPEVSRPAPEDSHSASQRQIKGGPETERGPQTERGPGLQPWEEEDRGPGLQPRREEAFATAIWPLVDRFGGLFWLAVAAALPVLAGVSVKESLSLLDWSTIVLGLLCPTIAATLPALAVRVPRYVPTTFALLSLLTPILGLGTIRAGIIGAGSGVLSATAIGLTSVLLTLPFLAAGMFALGVTVIPTAPHSRHVRTRATLLVLSAVVVLIAAMQLHALARLLDAGGGSYPWLSGLLVRLASLGATP